MVSEHCTTRRLHWNRIKDRPWRLLLSAVFSDVSVARNDPSRGMVRYCSTILVGAPCDLTRAHVPALFEIRNGAGMVTHDMTPNGAAWPPPFGLGLGGIDNLKIGLNDDSAREGV